MNNINTETPTTTRVAIVQQPAPYFDLPAALAKAVEHVEEAAAAGASLVVFPETWVGGYPAWIFGRTGWQDEQAKDWYRLMLASSPYIGGPDDHGDDLGPLRAAAAKHEVTVVVGVNERSAPDSGTIFNSLVTIDHTGRVANVHRKLTPTHAEKVVWANGDGAGLRVIPTPTGRVGGLVCWEHWNPLARQALHSQDEQIHVAAFPDAPDSHHLAARSYAFEGSCFVIFAAAFVSVADLPAELLEEFRQGVTSERADQEIIFNGGSGVIGPDGKWLSAPTFDVATTLIVDLDLDRLGGEKLTMDIAGGAVARAPPGSTTT